MLFVVWRRCENYKGSNVRHTGLVQDRLGTCCPGEAGWYGRQLAEVEMGNEGQAARPGTINWKGCRQDRQLSCLWGGLLWEMLLDHGDSPVQDISFCWCWVEFGLSVVRCPQLGAKGWGPSTVPGRTSSCRAQASLPKVGMNGKVKGPPSSPRREGPWKHPTSCQWGPLSPVAFLVVEV